MAVLLLMLVRPGLIRKALVLMRIPAKWIVLRIMKMKEKPNCKPYYNNFRSGWINIRYKRYSTSRLRSYFGLISIFKIFHRWSLCDLCKMFASLSKKFCVIAIPEIIRCIKEEKKNGLFYNVIEVLRVPSVNLNPRTGNRNYMNIFRKESRIIKVFDRLVQDL